MLPARRIYGISFVFKKTKNTGLGYGGRCQFSGWKRPRDRSSRQLRQECADPERQPGRDAVGKISVHAYGWSRFSISFGSITDADSVDPPGRGQREAEHCTMGAPGRNRIVLRRNGAIPALPRQGDFRDHGIMHRIASIDMEGFADIQ